MSSESRAATTLQVGRVGVLAAALGVGSAVAISLAGAASAETEQSAGPAAGASSVSRTAERPARAAERPARAAERPARTVSSAAVRRPANTGTAPAVRRAAAVKSTVPQAPAVPTVFSAIAAVGRDVQRIFDNRYPSTSPTITSQDANGVVTGTLGAVDPDGDRLVYSVIATPTLGRVVVDQGTGIFTYTPVVDVASYGGTDAFTVSVSDDTRFHIHGLQGLLDAPIRLLRAIPFVGSLLSDYLPATTTTATVKLTFEGSGTEAKLSFPDGFRWAVSTAGFQSEMGGGAPTDINSDWWQWTHDPFNKLLLGWRGGVPEDGPGGYLQYVTDARLASEGVGADTFRTGIEWSRIFPNSTQSVDISDGITIEVLQQLDALADQQEVAHYRDQLAAMRAAGLDPMVTVNHFTLPLWIHDPARSRIEEIFGRTPQTGGGWVSSSTVAEFQKYSAYLAWKYGDQVDDWVVLNEPVNSMLTSYYAIPFATNFPPAVVRTDLVAVGLLNQAAAYSASYDLIHQFDPEAQVGFALNMYSWRGGDPTNPGDQQAAADFSDFYNRWFPDAVLRGEVDANFDGVITADEIHPELAGKADYFGVNYYSQGIVISYGGVSVPGLPIVKGYPEFSPLINVVAGGCPATECTDTAQIINPAGLREVLDIADSYGIPLWIGENGLADAADTKRASYIVRHLAVINKAIADGMDIRGYTAWSLTDNLEWVLGYQPRYGLYSYDPVTLERTPRPSVSLVREIFSGNAIPAEVFRTYVRDIRV